MGAGLVETGTGIGGTATETTETGVEAGIGETETTTEEETEGIGTTIEIGIEGGTIETGVEKDIGRGARPVTDAEDNHNL